MPRLRRYKYDVFVSHAVEDKMAIANDLTAALEARGIKVWYSGKELSVGDHLIETIYQGLEESRYGVVILSPTYLSKVWALGEFFFFLTRDAKGAKVILPVLHDITPEELGAKYPLMANIVGLRASAGVDIVADKLYKVIRPDIAPGMSVGGINFPWPFEINWRQVRQLSLFLGALICLIASMYGVYRWQQSRPTNELVQEVIDKRISALQEKARTEFDQSILNFKASQLSTSTAINNAYTHFQQAKSYYRNEYVLDNGFQVTRGKRNVDITQATDVAAMTPVNSYFLTSPSIYTSSENGLPNRVERLFYFNTQPVTYTYKEQDDLDGFYTVSVEYEQPMRFIYTLLKFPASTSDTRQHQMNIVGFHKTENYVFREEGGHWILKIVR